MNLNTWKIITTVLLALLIGITIYVFLKGQHLNINSAIDTNKFNNFGGFVAGVISGISIFLVLLTYFFSLEANEIQKIEGYYQSLNNDIADAFYNDKKGVEAYLAYDMSGPIKNVIRDNVNLVLCGFETYLSLIQKNKFLPKKVKQNYLTRLHLLYYSKVLWPLHETIIKNGIDIIKNDKHDDSKIILPKYADLSIRCINHLLNNMIVQESEWKNRTIKKFEEIRDITQSQ